MNRSRKIKLKDVSVIVKRTSNNIAVILLEKSDLFIIKIIAYLDMKMAEVISYKHQSILSQVYNEDNYFDINLKISLNNKAYKILSNINN